MRNLAGASSHKPLSEELALKPGARLSGSDLTSALSCIAARSADVLGSREHALIWLQHHPVPVLGGQTSAKVLADGWGEAVLGYIDEMRYGSRG